MPAESRVVDRWSGDKGQWAYAIVERPGMLKTINQRYADHMGGVALHAFVPGWAQFQQERDLAGWTYIVGVGVGIIAGVSGTILAADKVARRDRETTPKLKTYYDDQANQYFWLSTAGYALTGVSYIVNVLDGVTVRVEPYRLLTSLDPAGIELVLKF